MALSIRILSQTILASVAGLLTFSALTAAQRAGVPIHGVTGTLALPGNVDRIYDGVNTLVVKTVDGANHVIRVDKDTKVHGGAEALASLQQGTPVVVHYTMKGDQVSADEIDQLGADGLKNTEGSVTAVDRVHKTVTVKYATGATERLKLTHHAAAEGTPAKGNRVIVYYTNDSGEKVAHYFKRK
jgi:hypothetical protein